MFSESSSDTFFGKGRPNGRARAKYFFIAILLSTLSILSCARNQDDSQVRRIFAESGLEIEFQQLPFVVQTLFDRSVPEDEHVRKLPEEVLAAMRNSIPEAFAPEKLKNVMLSELSGKLTAQDTKAVQDWLESPLGRKCTRLEEAASMPEAQNDIENYANRLHDSPPTPERLAAIKEFDSAVKATDSAVEIALHTQVAVALAIISTFPREMQRPLDDLSREVEKNRPLLEATVKSQILVSHLYIYNSLTDEEFRHYIEFAKSPAGTKYHEVTMTAFGKAILEGAVKWGELIGRAIKSAREDSRA